MMKPGEFTLNGISSLTYGVLIQDRPTIETPRRRVEFKTAFAMSGELPYDEDAYDNTRMDLNLLVQASATRSVSDTREIVQDWFDRGAYMDFIPYFDEDKTYHVMTVEAPKFTTKYFMEGHQVMETQLTVKPYKHYLVSPKKIFTTAGSITNPHLKASRPLIKVVGNGDITLTINGIPFLLKGVSGHIYIDSEVSFAYTDTGGVLSNANNKVRTLNYPYLKPGNNTIAWTGSVTSVEVEPRWRALV